MKCNGSLECGAGQYLVFELEGTAYGVVISTVKEIIHLMTVTRVPRKPAHIRGVMNLRGKVVPILDLRILLGMKPEAGQAESRIVVMEVEASDVGFVVDRVCEVLIFTAAQMEDAPEFGSRVDTRFVQGVGTVDGQVTILLDLNKAVEHQPVSAPSQ